MVPEGVELSGHLAQPGDHVIVSGFMGDHGVAIMSLRNHLQFQTQIQSDSAALHEMVAEMIAPGFQIRCLRDPTRGGLATTLNEWALQSGVGFDIDEHKIPIRTEVASACELLGLDALYVANEGKLLAICAPEDSSALLQKMRAHPLGKNAEIIGRVIEDPHHFVQLNTKMGGVRILNWLAGEQLPRIC
jgi:hydrogenase expression/formation protein HypE